MLSYPDTHIHTHSQPYTYICISKDWIEEISCFLRVCVRSNFIKTKTYFTNDSHWIINFVSAGLFNSFHKEFLVIIFNYVFRISYESFIRERWKGDCSFSKENYKILIFNTNPRDFYQTHPIHLLMIRHSF